MGLWLIGRVHCVQWLEDGCGMCVCSSAHFVRFWAGWVFGCLSVWVIGRGGSYWFVGLVGVLSQLEAECEHNFFPMKKFGFLIHPYMSISGGGRVNHTISSLTNCV